MDNIGTHDMLHGNTALLQMSSHMLHNDASVTFHHNHAALKLQQKRSDMISKVGCTSCREPWLCVQGPHKGSGKKRMQEANSDTKFRMGQQDADFFKKLHKVISV